MASNEEIIDYVMESPDNTNPNVLRSMLGNGGGSYVLPVASADTLGGVKVGSGLSITDGVLSVSGGGGGGALVVTDTGGTLDKTWQEIHDAAPLVWLTDGEGGFNLLNSVFEDDGDYCINFVSPQPSKNTIVTYVASSADGYPVVQK